MKPVFSCGYLFSVHACAAKISQFDLGSFQISPMCSAPTEVLCVAGMPDLFPSGSSDA